LYHCKILREGGTEVQAVCCGVSCVPGDVSKGRSNFKFRGNQFKKNLGYTVQKILLRLLDPEDEGTRIVRKVGNCSQCPTFRNAAV
jgi:hypothetical protein